MALHLSKLIAKSSSTLKILINSTGFGTLKWDDVTNLSSPLWSPTKYSQVCGITLLNCQCTGYCLDTSIS